MKKILFSIGSISATIMLSAMYNLVHAQTSTVSGTITSEGKPVSGVIISQEGSTQTTVSSGSGKYQINITGESPVIIFRHPLYADYKLQVIDATHNIELQPKENSIEEVVLNAGYYKVKDRERTGSIAKVTAKEIENQPVVNVLSSVQGRVSGVNITQGSGTSGGGFDIQIRGKNSLRTEGNDPLYIIDGVPITSENTTKYGNTILPNAALNPLNGINPNEIESIEILKDADATSIYGSRGANGVVLITTKKGKKGKLNLILNTSYALSNAASKMKLLNTEQYLQMRKKAYQNDGITSLPATAYDVNGIWSNTKNTDWQKLLIGNTMSSSLSQFSVNGGQENSSFLFSFSHNEQTSVYTANFGYKTNSILGTYTFNSKDKKFVGSVSNISTFQTNNQINEDQTSKALLLSPNAPQLYTEDGSVNWENNTFTNPVAIFNSTYNNKSTSLNQSTSLSYEFYPFLTVKLNGGINYQNFSEFSFKPNTMYNPAYGLTSANSSAFNNNRSNLSYIVEPQISSTEEWGNNKIQALFGFTLQKSISEQSGIQGYGFETNALISNIAAAKLTVVSDQIRTEYNFASLFARINYQYATKYIINLTGRKDGSSRFGPSNKFAYFGSIGAAYILSEEEFLKNSNVLSFTKIRASLGTTGSDKIGDYQYLDTYTVSSNIYNAIVGIKPTRLYNPNFSWEKTLKFETALELSFLKNRLNANFAIYSNSSTNQLVGIPLPFTTGFTSIQSNLPAKVRNTGLEIDLHSINLKGKNWKWSTNFNITFPKSKLISFDGIEGSTYNNKYVVGEPLSIVKVYQFEGIDPITGTYKFKDVNGDGKISSPNDNVIVENIGVRNFGGLQNNLSFKNWSCSILFQFVKQRNWNYNHIMSTPGTMNNQPREVLDVWSQENPSGLYMSYSAGGNAIKNTAQLNFQNSTAAISDASFIRLKNIQLSYKIPVSNSILADAIIYFQGQNLLTLTKYFGLDPEFLTQGFLPPLKTFSIGAQLKF